MSEYKQNHYIPQMLLKNWSDDKKNINLYHIKSCEIKTAVPIAKQCKSSYLYGKDGKIEKLFGKIETGAGPIIKKIIDEDDFEYNMKLCTPLLRFIALQYIRTLYSFKRVKEFFNEQIKSTLKTAKKIDKSSNDLKHIDKEDIDKLEIGIEKQEVIHLPMLVYFFTCLLDLSFSILLADDDSEFFIGEDPIVEINPWLFEKHIVYNSGLIRHGVMIILPISKKKSICLYDKFTYSIKKKCILSKDDIEELNLYQFIKSNSCIYFSSACVDELNRLNHLKDKRKDYKMESVSIKYQKNKGLIGTRVKNLLYENKMSFYSIKYQAYIMKVDEKTIDRQEAVLASGIVKAKQFST